MTRSNSFTPSAPASPQNTTTKRFFQSTLFNIKFGGQRNTLPQNKDDSGSGIAKRTRSQTFNPSDSGSTVSDDAHDRKRPKLEPISPLNTWSAAPKYHHKGPFHQVTQPSFCSTYAITELPDAQVFYNPNFIDRSLAEEWRTQLDRLPEWYRPKLKVYGREITQSREIAAYSTSPGLTLKYSGHPVQLHSPFPPLLNHIASLLCTDGCLGSQVRFNHCMLNKYENGSIFIGKHSDNIENKVIVTISLGADRSWIMQRKSQSAELQSDNTHIMLRKRWTLKGGSLLVMQGQTQKFYTHQIPKELKVKAPRISITFRQLVYDDK
ncbi:uncharacterized protein MEPE_00172 [Melanopsichium pennsylvanicum]|uniref:Fe2OG dioxygenase domain-containing protein n=1 Tax=Melanopsichium pennsylvanicum TaxID=63383 RepID=A0AAJ5C2G3_9BASI|nr:uncharacterized protein MEPE_00172 [Melanopsichium pennsylvanicum]